MQSGSTGGTHFWRLCILSKVKFPWFSKQIIQLLKRNMSFIKKNPRHLLHIRAGTKNYGIRLSQSYAPLEATILELLSLNKSFWKPVNSLNRGNCHIPTLVSEVGEGASTPASKADLLSNHFSILPLFKETYM